MDKILSLLNNDARLSTAEIAKIAGISEAEAAAAIKAYEENNTIIGYKTIIDWDKVDHTEEMVTAFIEVKTTPQKDIGFDEIAQKIASCPEVESVYLMSGGFDLSVIVSGRSLREISRFVSEHLASIEAVQSTSTHFILKKYKEQGVDFAATSKDEREVLFSW